MPHVTNSTQSGHIWLSEPRPEARGVVGVILAAGKGRRMGMPKSLLTWRGQTFIDHLIKTQYIAGITHIVVVTFDRDGPFDAAATSQRRDATLVSTEPTVARDDQQDAQNAANRAPTPSLPPSYPAATHHRPSDLRVDVLTAPATAPMLHSLHAAIAHLCADEAAAPALLMGPVDQGPYPLALVQTLLDDFAPQRDGIRVPTYQGKPGHPILIGGGFVPRIPDDHPDGLRGFLRDHTERIEHIPLPYPAIARNLNTRDQYDAFLADHP